MSKPLAIVTVAFSRPITGSELMEAIKSIIGENNGAYGGSFHSEHAFDNGDVFTVGQYSKYPYDQIVVTPTRETTGVRPNETYESVEVMSHSWPFGSTFLVGYGEDSVINAVSEFAAKLKSHFGSSPEPSDTTAWPQKIKICAICNMIVSYSIDNLFCPTHGQNPPSRTVKVTIVDD